MIKVKNKPFKLFERVLIFDENIRIKNKHLKVLRARNDKHQLNQEELPKK